MVPMLRFCLAGELKAPHASPFRQGFLTPSHAFQLSWGKVPTHHGV
jgi:hypothetical protein